MTAASTWTDSGGNLWLFGGEQQSMPAGPSGDLNDLWEFNRSTNEWTHGWAGAAHKRTSRGVYGTLGTPAFPGNVPGARFGASSWTDDSGNIWLFGG